MRSSTFNILSGLIRTLFVSLVTLTAAAPIAHASAAQSAVPTDVLSATLTPLLTFPSDYPYYNVGPMAPGGDGNFYGMTSTGGDNGVGVIYKVSRAGDFSILHSFTLTEGQGNVSAFFGGLVAGPDGSLYGGTSAAYSSPVATSELFRISPAGVYSAIHQFPADGSQGSTSLPPSLSVSANGTLYGCNEGGGSNDSGICFAIDALGNFQTLHQFSAMDSSFINADGFAPGKPVLTGDGSVYGVTQRGGSSGNGTIFQIAKDGTFKVVQSLSSTATGIDTNLLAGTDGNLYGYVSCTNSGTRTCSGRGYVFSISSSGKQRVLYKPVLGVLAAHVNQVLAGNDGNLYADVSTSAPAEILVQVTPSGKSTLLHSFDSEAYYYGCNSTGCKVGDLNMNLDGFGATLNQSSDGTIYGITGLGGAYSSGTAFKLAHDGTFSLLFTFEINNPSIGKPLFNIWPADDGQLYGMAAGSQMHVYGLNPNGPMSVSAAFSPTSAKVGDTVTLSWTSQGTATCQLNSDIPINALYGTVATSGSESAVASVKASPIPFPFEYYVLDHWLASVQCTSSTGDIAGVTVPLIKN